jgi:hypothetical protein
LFDLTVRSDSAHSRRECWRRADNRILFGSHRGLLAETEHGIIVRPLAFFPASSVVRSSEAGQFELADQMSDGLNRRV